MRQEKVSVCWEGDGRGGRSGCRPPPRLTERTFYESALFFCLVSTFFLEGVGKGKEARLVNRLRGPKVIHNLIVG